MNFFGATESEHIFLQRNMPIYPGEPYMTESLRGLRICDQIGPTTGNHEFCVFELQTHALLM